MKYVKFIDSQTIDYPPKVKREADRTIFNYDENPELLLADGYKPLYEESTPEISNDYHLEYAYKETAKRVTRTCTAVLNTLEANKAWRMQQVEDDYRKQSKTPVEVPDQDYKVIADWFGTYTNVLSAFQFAASEGLEVSPKEVIVLDKEDPSKFKNITIASVDDIKPAYLAAMDKYQELAPQRNILLVGIQDAKTQEELESLLPAIMP